MVIGSVVSEILGGVVPPPQMLLHCQKEQMLLTVKRADIAPSLTVTIASYILFESIIGYLDLSNDYHTLEIDLEYLVVSGKLVAWLVRYHERFLL